MYTFTSRVRFSETDENGKLSLAGIMNYLQDCSVFHSEDVGNGTDVLKKRDRVWLSSSRIMASRRACSARRFSTVVFVSMRPSLCDGYSL